MINKTDVGRIIGNSWDFFHQPAVGTAGGIMIMWDSNLASFTVIEHTSQVVFGALTTPNKGLRHVAMVYGHKDFQVRRDLWNCLDKVMMIDVPTIVGGDFNCLLTTEDKRGGKRFKMTKGTEEMKSFMVNQDLHDLSIVGPKYTWCNNKHRITRIWERLDRCLLNSPAIQLVPSAYAKHLPRIASDYCPVAFKLEDTMHSHPKTFRFEDTWRSYPATKGIIAKLKDELQNDILKLQLQEDEAGGLSPEDLDTLCSKVREYNVTLVRLSTWWNQRAKAKWNEDVDTNSRFYHTYATARKNGKLNRQIKDENNTTVDDLDKIESKLDTADIDCLNSSFSETEFFNAVSQQGSNKSLGLDGSTSLFFKFYWDIIKDSKRRAINHFFTTGRMNGAWKDTLIVLIPKINTLLLSSLIQQRGLQIGIQTSNRAPKITHLLYADDVLLFGKASVSQLRVMMNLIKEYCGWTGQGVNQSKSLIIFGSSTNQSLKWKIGKKTGFKIVKEFHHLGIKIALRRLAKNDYQFFIYRALDKLNSWGARFLSMAGRIILEKSSLLSLPTFVSTHSLIPKKILYDLDRICRDFIWHQNKDNKGLRYIAWDDLCIPRNRGGLGMHSSVKRVGHLRARLAWRFFQNPSSLLFKCLTAEQASDIWNGKSK
ncbi:uncharacterized protein LOC110111775 [Dendrobium catenatum]|uniref:uncharacterized protein LOC110111775 n=1 Tax=Dendrobium catenatum TaxID=906689 RepID=UPI0009F4B88C|nr:uncharacterized protein LOC110111775 [Dendrobium catenatum]